MNLKVQNLCAKFIKMSFKTKKLTMSEKLSQKLSDSQLKKETGLVDIEDAIPEMKSQFFSPVATRLQRKTLNKPLTKIQDLTNVKRIKKEPKVEKIIKVEQVDDTKIAAKKEIPEEESKNLVDALWEPKDWQKMLDNIRSMRALIEAPVDTMGCHKCQDEDADRRTQRFQILVSLMLSSQTKDEVTHAAVERLRAHNLNPETICNMETATLEKLLHPVGFYKTKAKHLKLTSRILVDKYDSDIPKNATELMKLPGVGPKMAHLCMSEAWGEITGIGVDVHVHRISNRLNWVPKTTKDPEKTRVALEAWLPRPLWREINHALVGFGQTICLPVRPKCNFCLNKDICPSAGKSNEKPKSSKKQ